MRILVTGAGGLLGPAVLGEASGRGHEALGLARADMDVTDPMAVEGVVRAHEPDAVVHCAAFSQVDRAELERAMAMRVNRDGAAHLAAACRSVGAVLVYVSTDYVFGGPRDVPWGPGERARPENHYGQTKLEGERVVAASGAEHLVVRVSWLFGDARPSFVDAMVARAEAGEGLRLVDDQFSTPTWTRDASATILSLLEGGARGIYHVTSGGGAASRLDFASEALRILGLDVPVEPVHLASLREDARRPRYSVLDVGTTEGFLGRPLPGWRDSLRRYLEGRAP